MSAEVARRTLESTAPTINQDGKIGVEFTPGPNASFLKERLDLWDKLYAQQNTSNESMKDTELKIILIDGKSFSGVKHKTTPLEIAKKISPTLADKAVVAKIKYESNTEGETLAQYSMEDEEVSAESDSWSLWDLSRPLEGNCSLQILTFNDPEGKSVFWHSSAHVLGEALENLYGAQLTVGPPLSSGFYYDSYLGSMKFTEEDYTEIDAEVKKILKSHQVFQRLVCTKEQLLELFKHNPFKVQLISSKIPDGSKSTCYKCGTLIDLCRGPHLPSTNKIASMSVTKHSSAYWLGDSKADSLQRLYGISFPDKAQHKEYITFLQEAKKRDHRVLANDLNLFFFEPHFSPGSIFWLPYGAKLYTKLCDFLRTEYRLRGFTEVISPNIYSSDLWKISGHWDNYEGNMFTFDVEGKGWGMKPMNCPGHCLMFKHMSPSYRQLPVRLADFGVLHRNELSGSLSGATRVRRFQQDDGHIFCTEDQIYSEIKNALDFLFFVYSRFEFSYELLLSTRPEKFIGNIELWDKAEDILKAVLNSTKVAWKLNAGDGAFYGPKIDVLLHDALKRSHQCGTIQLDFQLPLRFNLQYQNQEAGVAEIAHKKEDGDEKIGESNDNSLRPGMARPVMIHRAIFGSLERMCGVLLEHTAGKFPFWLSPRQAIVLPINARNVKYANWVHKNLENFGYDSAVDDSNNTISKKVRTAQLQQWNFLLVVGDQEQKDVTVTVRNRAAPQEQEIMSLDKLLDKFSQLVKVNSQTLKQIETWESHYNDNTNGNGL